jgi:hypothetical protein
MPPPLPYPYEALAPTIDELTMRIHHDKHHATYVANLNAAFEGTQWADRPVEQLLADLDPLPEDTRTSVRNNAGGHGNHSLFSDVMVTDGGGEPAGTLGDAIEAAVRSSPRRPTRLASSGRCTLRLGARRRALPGRDRSGLVVFAYETGLVLPHADNSVPGEPGSHSPSLRWHVRHAPRSHPLDDRSGRSEDADFSEPRRDHSIPRGPAQ